MRRAVRFALLEHADPRGVHWDLMIERPDGAALTTWRLSRDPLATDADTPAERIADHRLAYLEYEGALSGGRGHVRRVDGGVARWLLEEDDRAAFELEGKTLRGAFEVVPGRAAQAVFRRC